MPDPFDSSHRKLKWAKENLVPDLHRRITEWINQDPYAEVVEPDAQPGWEVHKIKLVKPFPEAFGNIVGDAVGNLREVLDTAGYAIALALNNPAAKEYRIPFRQ